MKIAVVTTAYPSQNAPYQNMFVHTRNKWYAKHGMEVSQWVLSKETSKYEMDGIVVNRQPAPQIARNIASHDVVLVHLLQHSPFKHHDGGQVYQALMERRQPLVFFMHGIGVQKMFQSYPFDIRLKEPKTILKALYHDYYKITRMRKRIKQLVAAKHPVKFITPSQFLIKDASKSLGFDISPYAMANANGIDTKLFRYHGASNLYKNRQKILSIRPLDFGGKYAADLSVKVMPHLPPPIQMDLFGEGQHKAQVAQYIEQQNIGHNTRLHPHFIKNHEIPDLHAQYGIYYATTRTDTQGVSTCEAMASGLPIVSFDVGGVPEFVQHQQTGLLVKPFDVKAAALALARLANDKNLFIRLSENGRKAMEAIDIEKQVQVELQVAKGVIGL